MPVALARRQSTGLKAHLQDGFTPRNKQGRTLLGKALLLAVDEQEAAQSDARDVRVVVIQQKFEAVALIPALSM